MINVQGNCPMGCTEGLIVTGDGRIWCAALLCPRPDAAALILAETEAAHVVALGEDTFTVRHPLRERIDDALLDCAVHHDVAASPGLTLPPGRYRVTGEPGRGLTWELL